MKCKNYGVLCKSRARKDECGTQWYYCNDCLRHEARKEMKKYPNAFKNTHPELFR